MSEWTTKLWDMIKPIKVGMLASWNGDYAHARPMHHVQDTFDGTLYFFTRRPSAKTSEVAKFDDVCISYADHDASVYVSVSGRAEVMRDQALIDRFWNPFVAAWFPEGKDSPEVTLLKVQVTRAEYWDAPSSKLVQLYEIAKANLTGEQPDMGKHGRMRAV